MKLMPNILELIEKLCPNGVEYKNIGDLITIEKGKQLNKALLSDEGEYPVINGGIMPSGYWNEYNYDENKITISQGGASAGYVNYLETKFWAGAHCYVVVEVNDEINYRYVYHFLKSKELELQSSQIGAGIPSVSLKDIKDLKIAVPPLEVQDEIVHILDDFTLLSAELSAELKAREKQYEYYKDKIWENVRDYKTEKMSNLCEIGDGLHGTPIYSEGTELWFINGNNLDNGKIIINSSTKEVSQESYNRHYIDMKKGSILLSINGTIGKTAYYNEEKVILGKSVAYFNIIDESRIIKEYLYFYLQSQDAMNYYECSKTGSTIKNLGLKALRDMNIPLPSIEKQNEIVNILSRFDKLCNDISEGLPAEIEARKKQYEYYRDKLLTFKELKVNEG